MTAQSTTSAQIIPTALGVTYPVRLPGFEGPLDLLLHLIEREELDITEVSLLAVTDQYLEAVEELEEIEPGALADFLVIAARLLYLKSRRLLPQPRPPDEDEEEEPGSALVRQLMEYRQFRAVAAELRRREEVGMRAFVREAVHPGLERQLDLGNVDLQRLMDAVQKALRRIPSQPPIPQVHTYTITVAEQMERVLQRLRQAGQGGAQAPLAFDQFLNQAKNRVEIVVLFLAVLELMKQQEVHAFQDETFGEIWLVLQEKSTS
jgi:segregation and condensation protein A